MFLPNAKANAWLKTKNSCGNPTDQKITTHIVYATNIKTDSRKSQNWPIGSIPIDFGFFRLFLAFCHRRIQQFDNN